MPEAQNIHIGENSSEQVAYRLLQNIMTLEKRSLGSKNDGLTPVDRKYYLDTFAECMQAVRHPGGRLP